jgi:predicted MFS family arabinose efflux permease
MFKGANLPRHAWLTVILLWFAGALYFLDRVAVTTMHDSVIAAIPMTEAQYGLQISIFFWVYCVLSPMAGYVSDRFRRSRVIAASLLAWSIITFLTGYARTFESLMTMRVLLAFGEACYYSAAVALICDYHRGSTRSLANGLHVTGLMLGGAAAGIGGWLADTRGWNFTFFVLGVIGVVYSLLIFLFLRDAPKEHEEHPAPEAQEPTSFVAAFKSLFSSAPFWLAFCFWGLLGIIMGLVVGWMPTYIMERFHLTQGTAGFVSTSYSSVASFIGVLGGGALADVWSRRNRYARILVPAIGLCLAAPGVFLVASSKVLFLAIAGLCLYALTRAFTDSNLMPILCIIVDPRYRATAYGYLDMLSFLMSGLAIYLGGVFRDAHIGLSRVLMVSAVSVVMCAALLFALAVKASRMPRLNGTEA